MSEPTTKSAFPAAAASPNSVLGHTVKMQGQLTASEDLLIDGKFEGNIALQNHCLTVGKDGDVKAEVRARQVVIHGSIAGNITAKEKIEIRRTGHAVGDLLAGTVAIDEGAYFKGSIDIVRDEGSEARSDVATPSVVRS